MEWDESVYIIDQCARNASLLAGLQREDETLSLRVCSFPAFTLAARKKKASQHLACHDKSINQLVHQKKIWSFVVSGSSFWNVCAPFMCPNDGKYRF